MSFSRASFSLVEVYFVEIFPVQLFLNCNYFFVEFYFVEVFPVQLFLYCNYFLGGFILLRFSQCNYFSNTKFYIGKNNFIESSHRIFYLDPSGHPESRDNIAMGGLQTYPCTFSR